MTDKSKSTPAEKTKPTAVAPYEPMAGGNIMKLANGMEFKVVRKVTVPTLSQKGNEVVALKITAPMYIGKVLKPKEGEAAMPAATLLPCIDLQDNIEKLYVVPAVFKSQLEQDYANDSYVGKSFALQKLPKQEGKRHRNMNIVEIA